MPDNRRVKETGGVNFFNLVILNRLSIFPNWQCRDNQNHLTEEELEAGNHTIRVAYVDGYYNVDAFIVRGLATATPTATAYTPSPTPSRTNTPIPPSTETFTPTATNAPTVTPTPLASEPVPQALTGAQYAYDGDGTMMRGTLNGLTTFYPGRHYNKEVGPGATKIQKFYFAGTITIAMRTLTDTADTLTWVLGDHLGSASTTANENGTLNSVIQYTAFGEIRLTQGLTPTKYRYTGQLAQAELGLDFYVSRMYDPLTAHFTTADTIIPEPGKSQSFDRYEYVHNNPMKNVDPTGHCGYPIYSDLKCWAMVDLIETIFQNITIGTEGEWSYEELKKIYDALTIAYEFHGSSQESFSNALGNITIVNTSLIDKGVAPPGTDLIILPDNYFVEGVDSNYLILHEIGHKFDFEGSNGNQAYYKSGTFTAAFDSDCKPGILGCLGTSPNNTYIMLDFVTSGGGIGQYQPSDKYTTDYAQKFGSIDDFAESYASAALEIKGLEAPIGSIVKSKVRKGIIHWWVNSRRIKNEREEE